MLDHFCRSDVGKLIRVTRIGRTGGVSDSWHTVLSCTHECVSTERIFELAGFEQTTFILPLASKSDEVPT